MKKEEIRYATWVVILAIALWGCIAQNKKSDRHRNQPGPSVDCDVRGECPQIMILDDPPSTGPGTFHGYADSIIAHDLDVLDRLWLAYSWLDITTGTDPSGKPVLMAVVSSHLARSDDGGTTFNFVGELYPATPLVDPEGSGENGILSSETVSLAAMRSGGDVTWYGAHLRYFLRPKRGYNPNYATSWTVRIGAAPSPDQLGDTEVVENETILGVSMTSPSYNLKVQLDKLAGLPIQKCAMVNNPALFAQNGSLYLIVECLAFVGTDSDYDNSTIQVFGTTPFGNPQTWIWRHVGKLSDHSLAEELGADTLLQPEVTLAADGSLMLMVTPAHIDHSLQVRTRGEGCVAIEIDSLDPPMIKRNSEGRSVVRANIEGKGFCACTYDNASTTGILTHVQWEGHFYTMHATGLRP